MDRSCRFNSNNLCPRLCNLSGGRFKFQCCQVSLIHSRGKTCIKTSFSFSYLTSFLSFSSRSNVGDRVQGFLQAMLRGGSAKRSPELPAPLRHVSAELVELGTAFGRIVHFNRTVFGPFYAPVLRKLLFPPGECEAGEISR